MTGRQVLSGTYVLGLLLLLVAWFLEAGVTCG